MAYFVMVPYDFMILLFVCYLYSKSQLCARQFMNWVQLGTSWLASMVSLYQVLFAMTGWDCFCSVIWNKISLVSSALPSSYIATLQFVRQGSSAIKREIFS